MGSWSRRRALALGVLGVSWSLFWGSAAWAFPLQARVVSKVSVGKAPQLIVHAFEPAQKAFVELMRDDGKRFIYRIGSLGAGAERTFALDASVGEHEYEGKLLAEVEGEQESAPLSFVTVVARPISVTVAREDLDLEKGTLRFDVSRAVTVAQIRVVGLDGEVLSEQVADLDANKTKGLEVTFSPVDSAKLARIELRVEDEHGFFRTISLTPWSVEIPHEEVLFSTNSSTIEASEEPKLEHSLEQVRAALARYEQIRGVQLFIAGHTDTRGSAAHNKQLSRARARSIAAWFVSHGLHIKVFYAGFGESALKVKTADEVDEAQNRRVDYILSVERPSSAGWTALN